MGFASGVFRPASPAFFTIFERIPRPPRPIDQIMTAFKKFWNILTTVLVVLVAILAVLLAGVRLFGFQVFTVLSGSMEPTYHVGSLIYVKEVDYRQLKGGDVITFMLDEKTVATHRIVEVVPDEDDPATLRYRTKGDANDVEDGSLVHYKNVLGSPKFSVPYLGYLANFIQNPPGSYIAMSGGAVLLILVFLPDILFSDDGKKDKKKDGEGEDVPPRKRPAKKKGGKYAR